ncbi:DMT family transporter [Comamonas sp. NLF-1-9]|uniref:DMT family transporter n=1 Tax=Comamonas sp. NLF-1-9 TaxID=2853163 RepID=UPI0021051845|nr:DMT family transporter [Comamonas sp. NLF-1-9]
MQTALLTAIAMLAFAANSVLARMALSDGAIDPLAYTGIRLSAGAAVLVCAALWHARRKQAGTARGVGAPARLPAGWLGGNWQGAFSLTLYAATFSVAYVMVPTGPGALILFAFVQIGMLAWAVYRGERPAPLEWLGMAIAFAALVYLVSPGLVAPPLLGAALMAVAGVAWGAYCLVGRGSQAPVADSAGNFARSAPAGLVLIAIGLLRLRPSWQGVALGLVSGAITSGLGYIIWYRALPRLSRSRAALVQLTVPAIAAAGGVVFIGEAITTRLVLATLGITGGVALALLASRHRKPAAERA